MDEDNRQVIDLDARRIGNAAEGNQNQAQDSFLNCSEATIAPMTPVSGSSLFADRLEKSTFQHAEHQMTDLEETHLGNQRSSSAQSLAWIPSLLRLGPLFGLGALLIAFLQLVASFAVLKASDGDEISNWKYQPSVIFGEWERCCHGCAGHVLLTRQRRVQADSVLS